MMASRGMGMIAPRKVPRAKRRGDSKPVIGTGKPIKTYSKGGESKVNEAGNYTKPSLRKRLFEQIKGGSKGGDAGEWSARKAQMLAREYKKAGGGYK